MLGLWIKTFPGRTALLILGENPFFICFVLGRAPSSSRYTNPMGPALLSHIQVPHPCTAAFNEQIQIPFVL